jgi:DNA polymerase III delta subunit
MSAPKTTTGFENAVFVGLESFLVDEELSRLKGSFKGDASMNWSVFNAEDDPTMDEIMSLCNTLPFFAERRVVIIRNGHKLSALQMDQVASYLEDPCDATTLILVLEGEKADRDLQKLLRKFDGRAKITRFEPLRNRNDRIRWDHGQDRVPREEDGQGRGGAPRRHDREQHVVPGQRDLEALPVCRHQARHLHRRCA